MSVSIKPYFVCAFNTCISLPYGDECQDVIFNCVDVVLNQPTEILLRE